MFNLETMIRENPESVLQLQHDMKQGVIVEVFNEAEGEQLAVLRIEGNDIEEL